MHALTVLEVERPTLHISHFQKCLYAHQRTHVRETRRQSEYEAIYLQFFVSHETTLLSRIQIEG
jgi:hypothetical protein